MSASFPWISCAAALALASPVEPQAAFEQGVAAYRRGDYAGAREHWQAALHGDLGRLERARVFYDLGNAAWRLAQPLEAIACYTAAARLDPRLEEARRNLELARAKAGLPPADAGDLGATLGRVHARLFPGERRLLALGALCAWAVVLALEILFGGAALRRLVLAGAAAALLAALPWVLGRLRPEPAASLIVVQQGSVPLRSEPVPGRDPIGELAPLEEVERIDALPGWVRIERADGLRGWVQEGGLMVLLLSSGHE